MTHAEAIFAIRLLIDRADQTTPSEHRRMKCPVYNETEIAMAKEALDVLDRQARIS